jgi:hypothetical protein
LERPLEGMPAAFLYAKVPSMRVPATITHPDDPAALGFPPTLPIEVAMRIAPIKEICESYGLSRQDWEDLKCSPMFVQAVGLYREELKKEGMSFKLKARLQSEELLKQSWKLIHSSNDDVPPNVKADLIKATVKWAGLEPRNSPDAASVGTALQININLG